MALVQEQGGAGCMSEACLLEGQSSTVEEQPSSQQLSSCSSSPSIPSCVQTVCTPQQLTQHRSVAAQRCKGTGAESGLPPIAVAAGPAASSAAGAVRHVLPPAQPSPQQLLQPPDLLLPATRLPAHTQVSTQLCSCAATVPCFVTTGQAYGHLGNQLWRHCVQDATVILELLPQVAAALESLQSRQRHPGSTQQQLLEGMQQALSVLEPAQLQQQLHLLLQAQRWSAAAHEQQEQEAGTVRIMPWGGEMQAPDCAEAGCRPMPPAGPGGLGGAAAVLSSLLTASLSTR